MTNDRARHTIAQIEAALAEDGEPTAIREVIQIIQELATKAFSISVGELSRLIGRDPTITQKVISSANTLGVNPSGQSVGTIPQAIQTIGFEKVRNLAIAILLAENASQTHNASEQREMAALSVCGGLMAQKLSAATDLRLDVELAFVCSSLRNYGKLLMATFLLDDYRSAQLLVRKNSDEGDAFREVFGLTPLQLTSHMLDRTNLPRSIKGTMREVPREALGRPVREPALQALILAEVSASVCDVAFNETIPPEQFNDALTNVLNKYGKSFPVNLDAINQAFIDIERDMSVFNRAIGANELANPASGKLRARTNGTELPAIGRRSQQKSVPERETGTAAESFDRSIARLSKGLEEGEAMDHKAVFEDATKALQEYLGLDACMAFFPDRIDPHLYSALYGCGKLHQRIRNRPLVSERKKDIFAICLDRREDVLIRDLEAGKVKAVIPDWILENSAARSIIILPVSVHDQVAAILFGTSDAGGLELGKTKREQIKVMRSHLRAILGRRTGNSPRQNHAPKLSQG